MSNCNEEAEIEIEMRLKELSYLKKRNLKGIEKKYNHKLRRKRKRESVCNRGRRCSLLT